jgi:Uma2 family endonuclease
MAQIIPRKIRSLPAERTVIYPESDGKPMAETDIHRDLMLDIIEMLKNHFRARPDVYVSGNLLLYYEKGNPQKSVVPDVFVVLGIEKKKRRTYLLWEEGKGPDFVLELVSPKTYREDLRKKKDLYASVLSVNEYYLYDPDGRYLQPSLQGYRLINGVYMPIQAVKDRFPSDVLGLELGEKDMELGLYNPQTKRWLLKPSEEAEARRQAETKAHREFQARQQAEARAQQAEAELIRLKTILERLHTDDE